MKKLLLILTTFLFSGCAIIFTGTKQEINFKSTPQNAEVYINGQSTCKTPCTAKVKKGPTFGRTMAEFRLENYETKEITLKKGFNWVSVINLPNWIGWAIDLSTGAIVKYHQTTYDVELVNKSNPHLIKIID
tara:strand:+ start:249 stop:644 length:396 start_codon:yes stop_codon:yes gene_type:complete